ncbi:unnamed protein product, partial [marine sediment metagenome]
ALLEDGDVVLTHCNAGSLATVQYGTALAPIRTAIENGKKISVIADETTSSEIFEGLSGKELNISQILFTAQKRLDAVGLVLRIRLAASSILLRNSSFGSALYSIVANAIPIAAATPIAGAPLIFMTLIDFATPL